MNFKEYLTTTNALQYLEQNPPERDEHYIELSTGTTLNFSKPDKSDITIDDISHGVSCISEQPDATTPVEPSRQLAPCRPFWI